MFIGTKKLTHTYMPGTPYAAEALKEINFSVTRGEFVVIIGHSGSGKSTLIQHLNGLLKPTTGQVIFDGRAIGSDKKELLDLRKRVGLVFQMPEEQFFSETVFDEVAFAPRNQGLSEEKVDVRVEEALAQVGLKVSELRERHPFQLSAGQKRLVAIAATLSLKPEVIILDEPTAGLDMLGRRNLFKLLVSMNHYEKLTVIISTHHLNEAAAPATSVFVLQDGRLAMSGPADDIFSRREQLHELGLRLPPVADIMYGLAQQSISVNTAIFTLDQARQEINRIKRRN